MSQSHQEILKAMRGLLAFWEGVIAAGIIEPLDEAPAPGQVVEGGR
jgi:hypothetical protein